MRLGLIGCSNIGSALAKAVNDRIISAELAVIYDKVAERAIKLKQNLLNVKPKIAASFEEFLEVSMDLAVEAASQDAVREYIPKLLEKGVSVAIMSVGALLDYSLFDNIKKCAEKSGAKIYIPSGAIGGIDAIKAASLIGIDQIELTVRKNPRSLIGAKVTDVKLETLKKPKLIYEGFGEEAVKLFPANVNVVATLTLASKRSVRVKIIADPKVDKNVHEFHVKGKFGEMTMKFVNTPSPENPKTSYIAIFSLIRLLKDITNSIKIG